jgi:predicted transcriptional regulator
MSAIKISSKVDEQAWADLKAMAEETHQSMSGLLTEAIREYLARRRVRPEVLNHLQRSIEENRRLGELLAR